MSVVKMNLCKIRCRSSACIEHGDPFVDEIPSPAVSLD